MRIHICYLRKKQYHYSCWIIKAVLTGWVCSEIFTTGIFSFAERIKKGREVFVAHHRQFISNSFGRDLTSWKRILRECLKITHMLDSGSRGGMCHKLE